MGRWIVSRPNNAPNRTSATYDEDFGDDHEAALAREAELVAKSCHNVVCWELPDVCGPWVGEVAS